MKRLLVFLTAASLLLAVPTFTGCASANKTAYKATATVAISADAAMSAWGDYVAHQRATGKPVAVSVEIQVRDAYLKYQSISIVAADAGASYSRASAAKDPNAGAALQGLNTAMSIASACLADLVNLIQQFGVKL